MLNAKGWFDVDFNSITPEQTEKAKACKSVDELVALAKAEGVLAIGQSSWRNLHRHNFARALE